MPIVPKSDQTASPGCRRFENLLCHLTKHSAGVARTYWPAQSVRKPHYSNPVQEKESPIKPGSSDSLPDEFRDSVKTRILKIHDIAAAEQEGLLSKAAPTTGKVKIRRHGAEDRGPTLGLRSTQQMSYLSMRFSNQTPQP